VKKALFAILAVVLSIGMMGSAFAYFTDTEYSVNNNLQAGTLDMQIADNNEGFGNVPVSASISVSNLAPGQSWTSDPIRFYNAGSIDIRYIFGRFCFLAGVDGLTADPEVAGVNNIYDYIILESYFEQANGTVGFYEETFDTTNANAYLVVWGLSQDGSISLGDLIAANNAGGSQKTGLWFFDGGNDPTNPPLPVGGQAQLKFKFKLLESTPNNYQGDAATFRMDFFGTQNELSIDTWITEAIDPDWAP
jgi:hypothetical protein